MAKGVGGGTLPKTKTKTAAKPKKTSTAVATSTPAKRLSKAGEWLEAHPGGICKILDMRAVMK